MLFANKSYKTPPEWLRFASICMDQITAGEYTDRSDIIVRVVDYLDREELPIAWYEPMTSDIYLNAQKITRMKENKSDILRSYDLDDFLVSPRFESSMFTTHDGDSKEASEPADIALLQIKGALIHEAAHSRWSYYVTEDWCRKLPPHQRAIIEQLEEVRIESLQMKTFCNSEHVADANKQRDKNFKTYIRPRNGIRAAFRSSYDIIKPSKEDLAKIADESGMVSKTSLALNSALTLGRADMDILNRYEVKLMQDLVTDLLGEDTVKEMSRIWTEFADIETMTEAKALRTIEAWEKLFPVPPGSEGPKIAMVLVGTPDDASDGDEGDEGEGEDSIKVAVSGKGEGDEEEGEGKGAGSGDSDQDGEGNAEQQNAKPESQGKQEGKGGPTSGSAADDLEQVYFPGLPDMLEEAEDDAAHKASKWVGSSDEEPPGHMIDPRKALKASAKATGGHLAVADHYSTHRRKPSASEVRMARELARELESISMPTRSRTRVASTTPPGRLRSKAIVTRAAEKSQGRAPTAQPWETVKRARTITPPLTVGIATDVSGSMGWAQSHSASASWIISRAVRHVNGTVASVAFGNEVDFTVLPSAPIPELVIREADGMYERPNDAFAMLDGVLRLTNPSNGLRMLFVYTDGEFVQQEQMIAAHRWVDLFLKRGVHIFWMTPSLGSRDTYWGKAYGYDKTPPNVNAIDLMPLATGDENAERTVLQTMIRSITQAMSRTTRQ